jgi:hypothetical protein
MLSSGMLRHVDLIRTDVSEQDQFLQDSNGTTSQKTAFFIVTALKISNPKYQWVYKTNTIQTTSES